MTEQTDETTDSDVSVKEIDREELYKALDKWKAALRFNQTLQSNYSDEITKWRTLRDQLKEEIKVLRDKALEEKALRDKINEKVAKLKEDRSAASSQIATLKQKRNDAWEQVKTIRAQLREIINLQREKRQQLEPIYPMMKRVEELDWTIMTKSMPFEQEEIMMDEIEKIISEISKRRQIFQGNDVNFDFEAAKKQIDEFREAAQQYHELMIQTVDDGDQIHAKILQLVQESEPHHQAMHESFAKIDEIQKEEEAAHEKFVENIKELELLRTGLDEIYKEIRGIEKKIAYLKHQAMIEKAKEQKAREAKILDQKIEEALAKYKAGKKLTMLEFSLLLKKGLIKNE
ncbi:MAG: hypothetical protein HWN65_08480 [Candidatus Helarchaeota archaeon]|nr:hypothetical protein [Candidatus Helarchaeota archaeon]